MLSKSQLSFIKSIQLKKFRKLHSLFIVEGLKSITEFLEADFVLSQLFYVSDMASNVANFPQKMKHYEISSSDLRKISSLKNPSGAIALFEMPLPAPLKTTEIQGKY